jgi:uncharacterized protein (TIGR03435 family)
MYEGLGLSPAYVQIAGGPAWMNSEFYEVDAKAAGAHVAEMEGPMLRALLEERFKLKVHREVRDAPVYVLTVAKGGSKLQPLKEGGCLPYDTDNQLGMPAPRKPTDPKYCRTMMANVSSPGTMEAYYYGVTMAELAGQFLRTWVDRPVLDKTGLAGRYDVKLEFTVDRRPGGMVFLDGEPAPDLPEAPDASQGTSIFSALQQQAGLKLTPDRGPVDVLVVDSVERPSEN